MLCWWRTLSWKAFVCRSWRRISENWSSIFIGWVGIRRARCPDRRRGWRGIRWYPKWSCYPGGTYHPRRWLWRTCLRSMRFHYEPWLLKLILWSFSMWPISGHLMRTLAVMVRAMWSRSWPWMLRWADNHWWWVRLRYLERPLLHEGRSNLGMRPYAW